jgi:hypothetical protein
MARRALSRSWKVVVDIQMSVKVIEDAGVSRHDFSILGFASLEETAEASLGALLRDAQPVCRAMYRGTPSDSDAMQTSVKARDTVSERLDSRPWSKQLSSVSNSPLWSPHLSPVSS